MQGGDSVGIEENSEEKWKEKVLVELKDARRKVKGARAEVVLPLAKLDKLLAMLQPVKP